RFGAQLCQVTNLDATIFGHDDRLRRCNLCRDFGDYGLFVIQIETQDQPPVIMLRACAAMIDCLPCIVSNTASDVRSSILAKPARELQNLFGYTICVGYRSLPMRCLSLCTNRMHAAQRSLIA